MDIISKYQKINNSFKPKLIFHFGTGAGFYSELNNMILCMLYCLHHKIRFVLYSKDAYFSAGNGISEFYVPFCTESSFLFHHKFNQRNQPSPYNIDLSIQLKNKCALTSIFLYKIFTGNYITSDVFYEYRSFWFRAESFNIPELGVFGGTQKVAGQLINGLLKFNLEYDKKIKELIATINLPSDYAGLHIRGGDKIQERELYSINRYIDKLEALCPIKDIFVMTDDYRIYEELKLGYPQYTFYTLTETQEKGYNNTSFSKTSREEQKKSIIKMFASVEILKNSEIIIGTYSANPGMYLGMIAPDKMHGIDFDSWQII